MLIESVKKSSTKPNKIFIIKSIKLIGWPRIDKKVYNNEVVVEKKEKKWVRKPRMRNEICA